MAVCFIEIVPIQDLSILFDLEGLIKTGDIEGFIRRKITHHCGQRDDQGFGDGRHRIKTSKLPVIHAMEMPSEDIEGDLRLSGRVDHTRRAFDDAALDVLHEPVHQASIDLLLESIQLRIRQGTDSKADGVCLEKLEQVADDSVSSERDVVDRGGTEGHERHCDGDDFVAL